MVETMQSICLEEAGIAGQLDEESTLVGLTFGGYLRSKVCLCNKLISSDQPSWFKHTS